MPCSFDGANFRQEKERAQRILCVLLSPLTRYWRKLARQNRVRIGAIRLGAGLPDGPRGEIVIQNNNGRIRIVFVRIRPYDLLCGEAAGPGHGLGIGPYGGNGVGARNGAGCEREGKDPSTRPVGQSQERRTLPARRDARSDNMK